MGTLLCDLYRLTMLDAYRREGMDEPAAFELFVRRLPPRRRPACAGVKSMPASTQDDQQRIASARLERFITVAVFPA